MGELPQTWNGKRFRHAWEYRSPTGELLGYVARYDGNSMNGRKPDKDCIPFFRKSGAGWTTGAPPEPRPLFGLDVLAGRPDRAVVVCEGEKCAAALHAVGLLSVNA